MLVYQQFPPLFKVLRSWKYKAFKSYFSSIFDINFAYKTKTFSFLPTTVFFEFRLLILFSTKDINLEAKNFNCLNSSQKVKIKKITVVELESLL